MTNSGWIKFYRKTREWEWYRNANAARLFFHLLLSVDRETGTMETTMAELAKAIGITPRMAATALANIAKSGEVVYSAHDRHYTEISVTNWGRYQDSECKTECKTNSQTECKTECKTQNAENQAIYDDACNSNGKTECKTNSQTECKTISTRSKKEDQELAPPESRTRAHEAVSPEDAAEARRLSFRCPYSEADVMEMAAFGGKAMAKEQAENFLGFFAPVWERQGYAPGRDIVVRQIKKWINQDEQRQKDKEAKNGENGGGSGFRVGKNGRTNRGVEGWFSGTNYGKPEGFR